MNELDYLGRHEHFSEDLAEIFGILDIPLKKVPAQNKTHGRSHYSSYYSDRTRELVHNMYRKDIQLFGYHFEAHEAQADASA